MGGMVVTIRQWHWHWPPTTTLVAGPKDTGHLIISKKQSKKQQQRYYLKQR